MRIATRHRWDRHVSVLHTMSGGDIYMTRAQEENAEAADGAVRVVEALLALTAEEYDALPRSVRDALES